MDAAKDILSRLSIESVEEMAVNESHTIVVEGFEELTIEKIGPNRVSVAHHYVQRGDLMYDPEIVFHIDNGVWRPVRYTQHPHIHQHNPDGIELDGFVEQWSENLRLQGFVEAAGDVSR
jgi:hypothetical protein